MKNTSKEETIRFIKDIANLDILVSKNERGQDYFWVDNGGGSDDDFIELGVETLVDLVRKAYVRGFANGMKNEK